MEGRIGTPLLKASQRWKEYIAAGPSLRRYLAGGSGGTSATGQIGPNERRPRKYGGDISGAVYADDYEPMAPTLVVPSWMILRIRGKFSRAADRRRK